MYILYILTFLKLHNQNHKLILTNGPRGTQSLTCNRGQELQTWFKHSVPDKWFYFRIIYIDFLFLWSSKTKALVWVSSGIQRPSHGLCRLQLHTGVKCPLMHHLPPDKGYYIRFFYTDISFDLSEIDMEFSFSFAFIVLRPDIDILHELFKQPIWRFFETNISTLQICAVKLQWGHN